MAMLRRGLAFAVKSATAAVAAESVGLTGLQYWTSQCVFEPLAQGTDSIFAHPWIKKINPKDHPCFSDCFVREVPFSSIQPELVKGAINGSAQLLERFAAGMWGGYGFDPQRTILKLVKKNESTSSDLWEREQLLQGTYKQGTIIADDFIVLDKTPSSVMLRGGSSPRPNPEGPREFDTILALITEIDQKRQVVRFKLKSLLLNGVDGESGPPIDSVAGYLHQIYAKVLLKTGTDYCMN